MKKSNVHWRETGILAIGEIIVGAVVVLGFFLSDLIFETGFTYRVFTGAVLGIAVAVLNFLGLSLSVNLAIDKYLALRGNAEMSEEEAAKFTAEHSMKIQNSIRTSFIVRTVTMLAALIVAFVLDWFSPLATAIPLLMYRPVLTLGELIRRKFDKAPSPEAFIQYASSEETEETEEALSEGSDE